MAFFGMDWTWPKVDILTHKKTGKNGLVKITSPFMREERKCASSFGFAFSRDHASEIGFGRGLFWMFAETFIDTPPGVSCLCC